MKIKTLFLSVLLTLFVTPVVALDMFEKDNPIQDGLNVIEVSEVFADIYEKLDGISWAGKSINLAIENLEQVHSSASIAATDNRVVLVWKDSIVANYPRPADRDWKAFGEITTALVLKLRTLVPEFRKLDEGQMYQVVVDTLLHGVDENGRYIYSKRADAMSDGRIITSVGIEGAIDERGNFRVQGIYKGSPADTDGVKVGDLITRINGEDVSDMSDEDVVDAFSGFSSGTLKLVVLNQIGERQVVLRRATIVLADADIIQRNDSETGTKILEVVVHKITDNAVAITNEALAKYKPSGIILDMRSATGDDERAAAKLAGLFIGQNPVMRVIESSKTESEILPGGAAVTNAPMVALVSVATRGTAEAVAAAIYENNRGVLVGTPTSGTARIASRIDLKNGGALEVMNKAIKTGQGRIIDGRGIFPTVCLSNIRSTKQQGAFFLNVLNGDFNSRDFNAEPDVAVESIRKGCPTITSGEDEDMVSAAVSAKILTDEKVYNKLMK